MTAFQTYRDAVEVLARAKRPLFILLENIDADNAGAVAALARALQISGASPLLVSRGAWPQNLSFVLPLSVPFTRLDAPPDFSQHDVVIIGDAGHSARTGFAKEIAAARDGGLPIINIDHHHIHEAFGSINLIDEQASATCELVYDLIKLGGWTINHEVATALLSGVIADTDAFTNAGTTVRSLEIAAHCYAEGADSRQVMKKLYEGKELNALRLWGTILSRLVENEALGIVATIILLKDFNQYDVSDEATDGIANFMNTISGMKAALILKELPDGMIKASLRSTRDDTDVAKFASFFGGGGHQKSAGFTIKGKLVEKDGGWSVEAPIELAAVLGGNTSGLAAASPLPSF